MRVALDPETRRLELAFESREHAERYLAEVRAVGGLQVDLEPRLSQYDVVTVAVSLGAGSEAAAACYAARITENDQGRFDTAFVVREWLMDSDQKILERLGASFSEGARDDPEAAEPNEKPGEGEARGVAPVHRLKKMNPGQKAIRAQRAGRAERQVLLRDNAPQVLQGLLVNPRLEAKEVLRIAKSTYATGAILQRIATDARWGKNQEILAAVVRNPKSPTLAVTRLMDKLRTSDLRQMAKMSSGLKEVLRKAALREYMKRSGA